MAQLPRFLPSRKQFFWQVKYLPALKVQRNNKKVLPPGLLRANNSCCDTCDIYAREMKRLRRFRQISKPQTASDLWAFNELHWVQKTYSRFAKKWKGNKPCGFYERMIAIVTFGIFMRVIEGFFEFPGKSERKCNRKLFLWLFNKLQRPQKSSRHSEFWAWKKILAGWMNERTFEKNLGWCRERTPRKIYGGSK